MADSLGLFVAPGASAAGTPLRSPPILLKEGRIHSGPEFVLSSLGAAEQKILGEFKRVNLTDMNLHRIVV